MARVHEAHFDGRTGRWRVRHYVPAGGWHTLVANELVGLYHARPMFGSHLSFAGGLHNPLSGAEKLGFHTVQVYHEDLDNRPMEAVTALHDRKGPNRWAS